jgi:hypothetical protein
VPILQIRLSVESIRLPNTRRYWLFSFRQTRVFFEMLYQRAPNYKLWHFCSYSGYIHQLLCPLTTDGKENTNQPVPTSLRQADSHSCCSDNRRWCVTSMLHHFEVRSQLRCVCVLHVSYMKVANAHKPFHGAKRGLVGISEVYKTQTSTLSHPHPAQQVINSS